MKGNHSRPLNFFIWGYYGYKNVGDEMMLGVIISNLKKDFPGCLIKVRTETPEKTKDQFNVDVLYETVYRRNSFIEKMRIVHELIRTDVFLFGGGTILHENCKSDWHILFYFFKLIFLARLFRKKVIFLGVGVGNIFTFLGKIFIKAIIRFSNMVILRDHRSKVVLNNLGIYSERIKVTADLSFLIDVPFVKTRNKNFVIGVSLLPVCADYPEFHKRIISCIPDVLNQLCEKYKAHLYFITMQDLISFSDKEFFKAIIPRLSIEKITILDYTENIMALNKEISQIDFIIAMRFHAIVLALLNQVPVVAISYNPKVKSIMEDFGLAKQSLDIKNLSKEFLFNCIDEAFSQKQVYQKVIEAKILESKNRSAESFRFLRSAVYS